MTMKRFSPLLCSAAIAATVTAFFPAAFAWAETAHHATEGEHEAGGLPQLNPDSYASQVFWLLLCFAVLYFFLARNILPQMTEIIEKRENLITGDLERAAQLKEEADKTKEAYEQALSQAENSAVSFMAETLQQLSQDISAQTQAAMRTIHGSLEKATAKIEKEKENAAAEIEHSIKDFADEIVEVLLESKTPKRKTATSGKKAKG